MRIFLLLVSGLFSFCAFSQPDSLENKLVLQAPVCGLVREDIQIRTRCFTSIEPSNSPLIVVDGIPADSSSIRKIDPQQIDKISVLKSSAASALYGSAARHGVIIINLKKAKKSRFTIVDETDSLPISSATVHLKSAFHNLTVVSDEKGEVVIPNLLKDNAYSMEVTHIGYQDFSKQVKFNGDNEAVTLSMKQKVNALAEVIVRSFTCIKCGVRCGGCRLRSFIIYTEPKQTKPFMANAFVTYPNPVTKGNAITIVSAKSMMANYRIASVSGQILKSGIVVVNEKMPFQVTTGNWPAGNYFLTLSSEDLQTKYTQKIIIQ